MFRLTTTGIAIADALERSSDLPDGHEPLTSRLRAAGLIHPVSTAHVEPTEVTVAIPVYLTRRDDLERLRHLVASLSSHRVIVVDDASPIPVPPDLAGATVVRHDVNRGPAAARNSATRLVTTPYVAFVDDDVDVSSAVLCGAAARCAAGAAMCAPRVRDAGTVVASPSRIGRYEALRSPLDLGARPGRVAPLSRVSYVPAAVIVARAQALRDVGDFDETIRTGEDVDLVWRLCRDHECRYEPSLVATHATRRTLRAFITQRFAYGSSAASLASRHGSHVTPYSSNLFLFLTMTTMATGFFTVAALCAMTHLVYVTTSLARAGDDSGNSFALAMRGLGHAVRVFTSAATRTWLPLYVVLAALLPRATWSLAACLVVVPLIEWWSSRTVDPFTYLGLRTIDNVSYCAGVWRGIVRSRSARCLAPRITLSRRPAA